MSRPCTTDNNSLEHRAHAKLATLRVAKLIARRFFFRFDNFYAYNAELHNVKTFPIFTSKTFVRLRAADDYT